MLTPRQKNKSKGLPERAAPFLGNREEVGGKPPLSMRAQCPCFRSPFCSVTLPGTGGAVTIRRRFPCGIGCGHCPQGSLAKGSWHAGGVTEGSHRRHFPKVQTNVDTCHLAESPRFCQRQNHPPLARGALACASILPGNDTGAGQGRKMWAWLWPRPRKGITYRRVPCSARDGPRCPGIPSAARDRRCRRSHRQSCR